MREGTHCWEEIQKVISKLAEKHTLHLSLYGDNSRRLSGKHETSNKEVFTHGVGNRAASVRIPTSTAATKCGYIEDRRPASDIDPYIVAAAILDTTILEKSLIEPLLTHYNTWIEWKLTEKI